MNKIKHILPCITLILLCFILSIGASALKPGDVIDYALATDIRAFINGYEIPSYNIKGRLAIVAEDLKGYGFDVAWNGTDRTLSITRNGKGVTAPVQIPMETKAPVGTQIRKVLYTDIVTYLDGKEVESFNINGYTIIHFADIAKYGSYLYDNDSRASMISFDRHDFKRITLENLPTNIIHAGGSCGPYLGSNSMEALNTSHWKGYRIYEMDFMMSSDGKPVCIHDWSQYYSNQLGSLPITQAEFENIRIFDLFTPVTLESLAKWLILHPGTYIVTDVKEDNLQILHYIADNYPSIIPRIIPQIYHYEEYLPTRAMGFSNIILTLYRLPTLDEKLDSEYNAQFAKKNALLAVAAERSIVNSSFLKPYINAGVPIYVHTVNDEADRQKFLDMGITGVYTDYAK